MVAAGRQTNFQLATQVTEQLVFELAAPEPPSFANFLPGGNAEALAAVKALAAGDAAETGVMLWGSPGAGKTHLLRAAVDAVSARGGAAVFVAEPGELLAQDPATLSRRAVVAIDGIEASWLDDVDRRTLRADFERDIADLRAAAPWPRP